MAGPAPTAAVNSSAVWDDGSATETAELLLTMRDCALSVAAAEGGRALIPLAEGTMHLLQAAPPPGAPPPHRPPPPPSSAPATPSPPPPPGWTRRCGRTGRAQTSTGPGGWRR